MHQTKIPHVLMFPVVVGVLALSSVPAPCGGEDAFWRIEELLDNGHYADAVEASKTLLADVETLAGSRSVRYAEALDLHVQAIWRHGLFMDPRTRALAEEAVEIKETHLGLDDPGVAKSLTILGGVLRDRGEFEAAVDVLDRAYEIRSRAYGESHTAVAETLHAQALLLGMGPDWRASRDIFERVLSIRRDALGPDDPRLAETMCVLDVLRQSTGARSSDERLAELGLSIAEANLRPEHPVVARCNWALGSVLSLSGDYEGSQQQYLRAIDILEKEVAGPERYRLVFPLAQLGFVQHSLGDREGSRATIEHAESLALATVGEFHRLTATVYMTSGNVLRASGDYVGSRSAFERVVRIAERLGPMHEELALTGWVNLASLLTSTGEYQDALGYFERAMPVMDRIHGSGSPRGLYLRTLYSELLFRMGRFGEAREIAETTLQARRDLIGASHPSLAEDLVGLAMIEQELGELEKALHHYREALDIRIARMGPDAPDVAMTLFRLSVAYMATGDHAGALDAAVRSAEIGRNNLRLTIRTLSERQALDYRTTGIMAALGTVVQAGLAAWHDDPDAASSVLDTIIRSRALVLDEMAARHRTLVAAEDAQAARDVDALSVARSRLAALVFDGPGDGPTDDYLAALDDARGVVERAERAVAARSSEFRKYRARQHIGLQAVAEALPPKSALVSYVIYERPIDSDPPARSRKSANVQSGRQVPALAAAILVDRSSVPILVDLGPYGDIGPLIDRWAFQIATKPEGMRNKLRRTELEYRMTGEALRQRIWDPVSAYLENVSTVFVVPSGSLHAVNLSTLPVTNGRYMVETGPTVHYLSAERDLVQRPSRGRSAPTLLALGGADFDAAGVSAPEAAAQLARVDPTRLDSREVYRGPRVDCELFRATEFAALPGSFREVKQIVALWRTMIERDDVDVIELTGASASETVFKTLAPRFSVLHLATHGFFLDERCDREPAASDSRDANVLEDAMGRPTVMTTNPLLRSGLVLAGANRRERSGPDDEDGILTSEEIASLDLSGVDWAVLSACSTGRGQSVVGEGVLGLRRAFEIAGARTMVMSLWAVPDEIARVWMTELYRSRARGISAADSVRRAALEILNGRRDAGKTTHPFYWGAFVAAGDWR